MTDETVIYQGAEAKIIKSIYLGKSVIRKHRVKKTYRIKEIDEMLISTRTKEEAKLIYLAHKHGADVPILYDIDLINGILVMSYIDGIRIKDFFDDIDNHHRKQLCRKIGKQIAVLHNHDIIHGDLTTSNMMLKDEKIYFIDFGLGEINHELEAKGVDLHVLMEALESTHSQHADYFKYVLVGYESIYHQDITQVKKKIDDIIKRGRYR